MKAEIAECILDHASGDLELRTDYSGRGMYGETTVALVGSREDFNEACANFLANAHEDDVPEDQLQEELEGVKDILVNARVDNMGLQFVFY